MKVIAVIADHPTPKFNKGRVAYTMNSRDYKAPLVVVTSYASGSHGRYTEGVGTLRASGGNRGGNIPIVTYQKVTGPLMANSHPGSYCGQDAYSDMLITGGNHVDHGNGPSERRNYEGGGVSNIERKP